MAECTLKGASNLISPSEGNTRVVYSDLNNNGVIELDTLMENCELLEEYHFYPFGLPVWNSPRGSTEWVPPGLPGGTSRSDNPHETCRMWIVPPGMEIEYWWSKQKDTITLNRYRYNGKEQQKELGWDWYNYGARYYDASVGRFTGVDPIADQFPHLSTYNYASNNPIVNIDLHGLQGIPFWLVDVGVKVVGALSGGNSTKSNPPFNNLVIGTDAQRQKALSNIHTISAVAQEIKNNSLDVVEKTMQDVQIGADIVEGGALTVTALTGGASAPVTVPLAGAAEVVGILALGVEAAVDVGKDGKLDATGTEILNKTIAGGAGILLNKAVDLLKIGGNHAQQSSDAIRAAGGGVINVGEAAANSVVDKKKER